MFSTFRANTDPTTTTTTTTNVSKSSARPRRRQQVSRACDWCRVNRIKCDDEQPCKNCQSRGEHCSNSRLLEATSLPSANRDILRLRSKVKDLQEQLRLARQEAAEARVRQAQIQTPAQTNSSNPSLHPSPDAIIDSIRVTEQSSDPAISKEWQGLRELGARTGNLYYGPMSSSYFLARITQYLSSDALNQSFGDVSLKKCLADINYKSTPQQQQQSLSDTPYYAEDLTRVQEEYYLVLLWQAFHCVYPILSETEFNQYYDSLWLSTATPDGTATRKPSALVDVLLAVCMQFGSVFLFGEHHGTQETQHAPQPQKNVHMAGHIHYQRAQRLLQNELEQPSIMTLQTHIYMIIYLYNTSQFNAAHSNLGTTLRIAQALRLHLQPAEGTSLDDQALYRRIWSNIYRLDAQLSMNLGRPALVQNSELDHDQPEQTRISGTSLLSSFEDISYLSFHIQCTKLISAVQGAQAAFETKCSQLLIDANSVNGDIHDDPIMTEALAEFFNRKTTLVREWVQSVPKSLKCARKGEGEAFSTDRSSLNLDTYIPLWLQRQRLLLELLYHHLQISLLRQFIRFPPVAQSLTPLADGLSISCVYHAITITNILHQVLSETDLAHGWFHVYQYQWDAVLCTLGFVLANPVCPPTPPARKSLKAAVRNLEIIGEHFPAAASAARLVHDVNGRMDRVTQQFRRNLMGWRRSSAAGQKDSTSLTPSPLDEVVLQKSTGSYLSETAATTSSLGLGPGVWSDQPVPAIEIGPTPLVTTIDTPTMSMALDDMQWMQGTIDSWTDFTV